MTLKFTILGCGSSGGVPRPALGWGACDPRQSQEPPPADLAPGRAAQRRRASPASWSTPRPTCASSCSTPRSTGSTRVLFTHEHADHTHGIDDLRGLFIASPAPVDVYLDEPTSKAMRARFGYCFQSPPGSEYPPIVTEHRLAPGRPVDRRRGGRPDHRAAGPAGARRHPLARLPLRRAGLFLRPERPARGQRHGAGRASRSGSSTRCATGRIPAISAWTMRWPGSSASSRAARS